MKNTTLYGVVISCLFSFNAWAQPQLAVKAGINYGGLSGYEDRKKASLHAGLALQWGKQKAIRVQPELVYNRIVQGYLADQNEVLVENTVAISFFSMPLMIQYYPAKSFYIEAGPNWSFTSGAKDRDAGGHQADVKRNLADVQFGFAAGAGMELHQKLSFYLRYHAGFTDMTLYDANNDFSRFAQAGFLLRLGGKK